ncbi:MAG TPA: tetratricopeptide repeat protein, partial [Robiginitalea sp.]|nr:tetratricopeptide repeat protein [Robiginitalea sp.]
MAALRNAANDTVRLDISRKLGFYHQDSQADSALVYHTRQLELAKKLNLKLWEADAYQQIGYCYLNLDNLPVAYENYMQAMKMAEDPSTADNGWGYENFSYSNSPEEARQSIVGMLHFELSGFYNRTRFYDESLEQLFKAVRIGERLKNQKILSLSNRDIGTYYLRNNSPDSAYVYFQKSLMHYQNSPYQKNLGVSYLNMAYYHGLMQEYDLAKAYLRRAMDENAKSSSLTALGLAYRFMGRVYERTGQLDSALEYTFTGLKIADSLNDYDGMINGNIRLGNLYKLKNDHALAYDYL